jgi:hypothetical protein
VAEFVHPGKIPQSGRLLFKLDFLHLLVCFFCLVLFQFVASRFRVELMITPEVAVEAVPLQQLSKSNRLTISLIIAVMNLILTVIIPVAIIMVVIRSSLSVGE